MTKKFILKNLKNFFLLSLLLNVTISFAKQRLAKDEIELIDESGDGYISNNETACLSFTFNNTYHLDEEYFSIISTDNRIIFNGALKLKDLGNGDSRLALSVTGINILDSTVIPFKITQFYKGQNKTLYENFIKAKSEVFNRISLENTFKISGMEGIWIGDYGGNIFSLTSDGLYQNKAFFRGDIITQNGAWKHFTNPCDQKEYISLTGSKSSSKRAENNEIASYKITNDYEKHNPYRIRGVNVWKGGGYNEIVWQKLENTAPDSTLIAELNYWMVGKWYNDAFSDSRTNFKPNHDVVSYNSLNRADFGTWFWTTRMEDGKMKVFLWTVEGTVFGTTKYEVEVEKSSINHIVLLKGNDELSFTRNEELDIPETYVGRPFNGNWVVNMFASIAAANDDMGFLIFLIEYVNNENRDITGEAYYKNLAERLSNPVVSKSTGCYTGKQYDLKDLNLSVNFPEDPKFIPHESTSTIMKEYQSIRLDTSDNYFTFSFLHFKPKNAIDSLHLITIMQNIISNTSGKGIYEQLISKKTIQFKNRNAIRYQFKGHLDNRNFESVLNLLVFIDKDAAVQMYMLSPPEHLDDGYSDCYFNSLQFN